MVELLFDEIKNIPEVEAIALGGSSAGENFDEKSDYDVYLYCTGDISDDVRKTILEKYCSYIELGNHFWELEDNCTLKNGVDIDILYRNIEDFGNDVASVVEGFNARTGYTTCMWHNLLTCKIIYDEKGNLKALKDRFNVTYPKELKKNIINKNMSLLNGMLPSYDGQILKAVKRGDLVSVNHRTSAFFESYFDVLFALNEQTHPGEKRLVSLSKRLSMLPANFEENINKLFADLFTQPEKIGNDISEIVAELRKIV
ncbi:MAG: DUF4037 domain-containing protein [Clostridia bacterium]|nr:DUF4037 domain-containing protein [Clostridia bacterium]